MPKYGKRPKIAQPLRRLSLASAAVLVVNAAVFLLIKYSGALIGALTGEKALSEILTQLKGAQILPSVGCFVLCTLACWGIEWALRKRPVCRKIAYALAICASAAATFCMVRVNSLPMHTALRAIIALAEGGVL